MRKLPFLVVLLQELVQVFPAGEESISHLLALLLNLLACSAYYRQWTFENLLVGRLQESKQSVRADVPLLCVQSCFQLANLHRRLFIFSSELSKPPPRAVEPPGTSPATEPSPRAPPAPAFLKLHGYEMSFEFVMICVVEDDHWSMISQTCDKLYSARDLFDVSNISFSSCKAFIWGRSLMNSSNLSSLFRISCNIVEFESSHIHNCDESLPLAFHCPCAGGC